MGSSERATFNNKVVSWIDERLPVFTLMQKEYGVFPTPRNFNYFWNFGAIAMFMLIAMIATGIFLAMNYTAHVDMAFNSVERIDRDVNWGWLLRDIHMNGASFFFIAVYIHIFRGLYYGSYKKPREILWILGVVIFLLMMATAFMGYVLPWGQMSYWGATVITNLFSAIPLVGGTIVEWLWGGFSVDNPTLNRFFALHYLLPFVIFAVVFVHVWALHVCGSNNPTGIEPKGKQDTLPFHPYYTMKDTFGLLVYLVIFCAFVFYAPDYLGHPDNYREANPLVTPAHIVPEWYFLPFYAMLRAITFSTNLIMLGGVGLMFLPVSWNVFSWVVRKLSGFKIGTFADLSPRLPYLVGGAVVFAVGVLLTDKVPVLAWPLISAKLGGVIAMFGSIALLFVLPWLDTHPIRSARYRPQFRLFLLIFLAAFVVLGYVGSQPAAATLADVKLAGIPIFARVPLLAGVPLQVIGLLGTAYYYAFFLVVLPWLNKTEKGKDVPKSIYDTVMAAEGKKK